MAKRHGAPQTDNLVFSRGILPRNGVAADGAYRSGVARICGRGPGTGSILRDGQLSLPGERAAHVVEAWWKGASG